MSGGKRPKTIPRSKPAPSGGGNDVKINYWCTQPSPPGLSWGPGVRDHHKLYFTYSGLGTLTIHGQTFTIQGGQGFYTPPNAVYHCVSDDTDPWLFSCLGFTGNMVDAIIDRTTLPEHPVFDNPPGIDIRWFEQFSELAERPGGDLQLQGMLYELLAALVRQSPAEAGGSDSARPREEYVRRAADYIHRHYDEEVSMRQLSDYLGLDRKYAATLFREALGIPPQQYLLRYRMDKACELLRSTGLTVAETARSVGYKDALLFSRMFKKVIGVPPSRYARGREAEQP